MKNINSKKILKNTLLIGFLGLALTSCGNANTFDKIPNVKTKCQEFLMTKEALLQQIRPAIAYAPNKAAQKDLINVYKDNLLDIAQNTFGKNNIKGLHEALEIGKYCKEI